MTSETYHFCNLKHFIELRFGEVQGAMAINH